MPKDEINKAVEKKFIKPYIYKYVYRLEVVYISHYNIILIHHVEFTDITNIDKTEYKIVLQYV